MTKRSRRIEVRVQRFLFSRTKEKWSGFIFSLLNFTLPLQFAYHSQTDAFFLSERETYFLTDTETYFSTQLNAPEEITIKEFSYHESFLSH